jgi:hypothetical protein
VSESVAGLELAAVVAGHDMLERAMTPNPCPVSRHASDCDCRSRSDGSWHIDPLCTVARRHVHIPSYWSRCEVCGELGYYNASA